MECKKCSFDQRHFVVIFALLCFNYMYMTVPFSRSIQLSKLLLTTCSENQLHRNNLEDTKMYPCKRRL